MGGNDLRMSLGDGSMGVEEADMSRPNSTPVYRDGARMRINGMAASSISNNLYDVSRCDECSSLVAWAQGKHGGWYLCKVMVYTTDAGREKIKAAPWIRHDCDEIVYELCSADGWRVSEHETYEEALAARQETASDDINNVVTPTSEDEIEGFKDELQSIAADCAEGAREAEESYRESADNIEEGFGLETYQSEELREKAVAIAGWCDELDGYVCGDYDGEFVGDMDPNDYEDEAEAEADFVDQLDTWAEMEKTNLMDMTDELLL